MTGGYTASAAGGNVPAPVPADDPRMIAWAAYQETDDYANDCKPALEHRQYVEGALWAAFCAGFTQGGICVGLVAARRDAERVGGVLGLSAAASKAAGQRDR